LTRILGVDPMDHGAFAWLDDEGGLVCVDMPVVKISKTRVEVDIDGLIQTIRESRAQKAYVEKLHPMPMGGGNANFKRGGYSYLLRGLLLAAGVSLVEVPPKEWQKMFGIRTTKDDDTKNQSYLMASRLYPLGEFKTERGTILDGRSDAALILEYGRRVESGNGK